MSNAELLSQLRLVQAHPDENGNFNRRRWPWIVGISVAAVMIGNVAVNAMQSPHAVTVKTVSALASSTGAPSGAVLQATGYVTARRQATVSSQVTGTLVEVLIEEGDHVEKGQILARLESSGQLASLCVAKASLLVAEAQSRKFFVQLEQAIRSADRFTWLSRKHLVAEQAAEQAQTNVMTLKAQLLSAQQQAESMRSQTNLAAVAVDHTVVRAPFSGVVVHKAAQVGEIVSPQSGGGGFTRSGVSTIVDMESLEVDVDVNEAYIGRVKTGMRAMVALDAYPDWHVPAHVIAIVPAADRGKATVKVRVGFEQKDERIVPEMGARVSFLEKAADSNPAPSGVLVPLATVVQRDGHSVVFIASEGRVARRDVIPAVEKYGDMLLLPTAVAMGEEVVLAPPTELSEGMKIKIDSEK